MSDTEENDQDHDQSIIKDQKINTGNLPRETMDCMKAAMKELIDPVEDKLNRRMQELIEPIEDKINKLLENRITDKKEQETELNLIKVKQSELYKKCLKIENEQNQIKSRLTKLEDKMLENNLII